MKLRKITSAPATGSRCPALQRNSVPEQQLRVPGDSRCPECKGEGSVHVHCGGIYVVKCKKCQGTGGAGNDEMRNRHPEKP